VHVQPSGDVIELVGEEVAVSIERQERPLGRREHQIIGRLTSGVSSHSMTCSTIPVAVIGCRMLSTA